MSKIRQILSLALVMMLAGMTAAVGAQNQRPYRTDDRTVQQLIRRIETRADNFRTSLGNALENSQLDNTRREDNINQLVSDFEQATNQLRDRFNNRQSTGSDVQTVLDRAARIDRLMQRNNLEPPPNASGVCSGMTSTRSRAITTSHGIGAMLRRITFRRITLESTTAGPARSG